MLCTKYIEFYGVSSEKRNNFLFLLSEEHSETSKSLGKCTNYYITAVTIRTYKEKNVFIKKLIDNTNTFLHFSSFNYTMSYSFK